MTVQELIEKLQQVENKQLPVVLESYNKYEMACETEEIFEVNIKENYISLYEID